MGAASARCRRSATRPTRARMRPGYDFSATRRAFRLRTSACRRGTRSCPQGCPPVRCQTTSPLLGPSWPAAPEVSAASFARKQATTPHVQIAHGTTGRCDSWVRCGAFSRLSCFFPVSLTRKHQHHCSVAPDTGVRSGHQDVAGGLLAGHLHLRQHEQLRLAFLLPWTVRQREPAGVRLVSSRIMEKLWACVFGGARMSRWF